MSHAKKKVVSPINKAQQTAQIIAQVKVLLAKNLIQFEQDVVLFYPEIWKDEPSAVNWMKCIYLYAKLKKIVGSSSMLYFKNIRNNEIVGTILNNNAKILMII